MQQRQKWRVIKFNGILTGDEVESRKVEDHVRQIENQRLHGTNKYKKIVFQRWKKQKIFLFETWVGPIALKGKRKIKTMSSFVVYPFTDLFSADGDI